MEEFDVMGHLLPALPVFIFWGFFAATAYVAWGAVWKRRWWKCSPFGIVALIGVAWGFSATSNLVGQYTNAPDFSTASIALAALGSLALLGIPLKLRENSRGIAFKMGQAITSSQNYAITDTPRFKFQGRPPFLALRPCVPASKIFEEKANANVMIFGTSGYGKTNTCNTLLRDYYGDVPKLIFCFKSDDIYRYYPDLQVVDLSKQPFDVFTSPPAFREAYRVAFPIGAVGVMGSLIPTVVYDAVKGSKTWRDYFAALDAMADAASRDAVRRSTTDNVMSHSRELAEDIPDGAGVWTWDFKTDLVLDFSQLRTRPQQNFYCEVILRSLWDQVGRSREPVRFVLFCDEAHRLLVRYGDETPSILDTMAREIRSSGGSLLLASQNYADLPEEASNQMAAILAYNTAAVNDLKALGGIHAQLPRLISSLPPYVCVDIRRPVVAGLDLYTFKIARAGETPRPKTATRGIVGKTPRVKVEKEKAVKPLEVGAEVVKPERLRGAEAMRVKRAPPAEVPAGVKPLKVLTEREREQLKADVLRSLARRPSYVSELGREFAEKYGKPPTTLKVDVHVLLKPLVGSGAVMQATLEDRWAKPFVLYWPREKGESAFHRVLIDHVGTIFAEFDVRPLPKRGLADLAVKWGRANVAVECETGLKHDLAEFAGEVKRRLRTFGAVWVVVPTRSERERYTRALATLRGVEVLTLQNLAVKVKRGVA